VHVTHTLPRPRLSARLLVGLGPGLRCPTDIQWRWWPKSQSRQKSHVLSIPRHGQGYTHRKPARPHKIGVPTQSRRRKLAATPHQVPGTTATTWQSKVCVDGSAARYRCLASLYLFVHRRAHPSIPPCDQATCTSLLANRSGHQGSLNDQFTSTTNRIFAWCSPHGDCRGHAHMLIHLWVHSGNKACSTCSRPPRPFTRARDPVRWPSNYSDLLAAPRYPRERVGSCPLVISFRQAHKKSLNAPRIPK